MSYESRIYVVDLDTVYPETIAALNLCCVEDVEFLKLFTNEIPSNIKTYFMDSDGRLTRDKYGCKVKSAPLSAIIEYAERRITDDNYRRMHPLLGLLKGFDTPAWEDNNLVVLHYGY